MSLISVLTCAVFRRGDKKRDAGLTTPDDIRRYDDIQYGPDRKWNMHDVYRPKGEEGKLPVIISVHGGGWVYGDKELYQYYCMSLAQHGFAVVNFTYRLAPRSKVPAQLEDTDLAVRWCLEHAEEYGLDTDNVFAVGDSAGAHLLGLYCCLCTDGEYASSVGVAPPEGFLPRAVALNCGVYHPEKKKGSDITALLMRDLLPGKGTAEEMERISVLNHLNAAFPPSFVMTCEGDFLAQAAPPLVERMKELGVPVEYRYYGDPDHVLGHVFHCNMRLEEGKKCNADECEYFRSRIV